MVSRASPRPQRTSNAAPSSLTSEPSPFRRRRLRHLGCRYRVTEGGTDDEPSLRHAVHISSGSKVFLRFRTHAPLPGTEEIDGASTPPASVCRWIETVEDATWSPPFTVFERGDGTFDQWLARPDKSCEEKKSALYKVWRSHFLPSLWRSRFRCRSSKPLRISTPADGRLEVRCPTESCGSPERTPGSCSTYARRNPEDPGGGRRRLPTPE